MQQGADHEKQRNGPPNVVSSDLDACGEVIATASTDRCGRGRWAADIAHRQPALCHFCAVMKGPCFASNEILLSMEFLGAANRCRVEAKHRTCVDVLVDASFV